MYRALYTISILLIGGFMFIQNGKQNYFYYEKIPNDIKEEILKTSFKETQDFSFKDLVLVHILHVGFDDLVHKGELIVNKKIANDIIEIFEQLYLNNYKIEKVKLIHKYNWNDDLSMTDNNTSAFNYRYIAGTNRLSNHSYGLAIDINPLYNPYVYKENNKLIVSPNISYPYVDRNKNFKYKIDTNDLCYKLFIEHGFTWGGNWASRKDYQHFEKMI